MRKRISGRVRPVGTAALAGFVATAVLTCGAGATAPRSPVNNLVLANANGNMCAAHAMCPKNPAPPDPDLGDQTTAEQRIIDGYIAKQRGCTPDLAPNPLGVNWDSPGFTPNAGGTGTVNDADPRLGGQFRADWVNGRWHIVYPYC
jgi:hypothetical protein